MQPYSGFASVYDLFMDNVPYDDWADYVRRILESYHIQDGLVLELGCGTGSLTRRLAGRGYDMIGIDNSEDMLRIAREKGEEYNDSILYLCQDMREFELFGTVAAVVSVCGSMNYILSEDELLRIFRLVNNYLDPKGIFIFDMDTLYEYGVVLGDHTIAENREEGSFIWENTFYEDEGINEINLALFIPEPEAEPAFDNISGNGTIYRRYEENHYRRAYPPETIRRLIEEAGMEWVAAYDAVTGQKPKKTSERMYIIAREKRQEGKLYCQEEQ